MNTYLKQNIASEFSNIEKKYQEQVRISSGKMF